MDKDQFIQTIEKMSVSELNELVKALEEKFGVSAAAFAAGAASSGQGGSVETEEEKDSFTVILKDAGAAKIQVIKVLRELTGLGLKEVKEGVKKEEAEEIKKKLEEAGATVELK